MKLVDLTCSQCGARLQVDMNKSKAFCPNCGNQLLVDDETKHIQYDNAEEAGYLFEKGRQRAQAEALKTQANGQTNSSVYYQRSTGKANIQKQPEKSNTWLWVLGWIFFFPAPVMILIWRKKNTWDVKIKLAVTIAFWLFIIIVGLMDDGSSSSENRTSQTDSTTVIQEKSENDSSNYQNEKNDDLDEKKSSLYADAEIVDIMSGSGKNVVGKMTISHANKDECTDEALSDWYMNFVKKNSECNAHVIIYNNDPDQGVYANGMGFIQKDIELKQEKDGTYACGDDAGSTYYSVAEDGSLSILWSMADASIIHDVEDKVDAIIPEEYKNGKSYEVDVAGTEGELDCNLILINPDFADVDCQSIALELAKKVQDLNLGIGYFSISFQSDDYTLNALSSVDLNKQDATEITTMNL